MGLAERGGCACTGGSETYGAIPDLEAWKAEVNSSRRGQTLSFVAYMQARCAGARRSSLALISMAEQAAAGQRRSVVTILL